MSDSTFARRNNVEKLLHEYWIDLQASSDRKSAIKAKLAQAFLPLDSTDQPIFDALQNPEWFSVDSVGNKQQRRRLDQQWSLPELVKKLQDPSAAIEPIKGMNSMFHSYGLQSEILHVSSKYYDLLWDRMLRTNDLFALENTHYCRQLTDAIQLTAFCVMLGLQRLGAPLDKLKTPIEIANDFSRLTESYKEEFDQSQGFA